MEPDLKRLRATVVKLGIRPLQNEEDELTAIDITAGIFAFASVVILLLNAANQTQTPSIFGTAILAVVTFFVVGGIVHALSMLMEFMLEILRQHWWIAIFVGIAFFIYAQAPT